MFFVPPCIMNRRAGIRRKWKYFKLWINWEGHSDTWYKDRYRDTIHTWILDTGVLYRYMDTWYGDTRYRDTRYRYTRYKNTRYRYTSYEDTKYRDTRYTDTKYRDTRYRDTRYRDTKYKIQGYRYTGIQYYFTEVCKL